MSNPYASEFHYTELTMVPDKRRSRLLAPIDRVEVPDAIVHCCSCTFQTEKSYLDKPMVIVADAPALRATLSNPFSFLGCAFADAGRER